MRRAIVIGVVGLFLAGLASPALAQNIPSGTRDPFEPLLTQETSGATGAAIGGGGATSGTTSGSPDSGISGSLSNTGADISPWLMAAYLLLTFGGCALVWSRVKAAPVRR